MKCRRYVIIDSNSMKGYYPIHDNGRNLLVMEMVNVKKGGQLTALDDYINRVYKIVLLLFPGACQCAGLLYTLEKFLGWLPEVSWAALIIFDITCLTYLTIGFYFVKTGMDKNGIVKPSKLKNAKIFLIIVEIVQWNYILYMIPATDFWGFAFFFVILTAFFLDYKLVAIVTAEIAGSLAVSWFIHGDITLPAKDDYFMANLLDRIVCVALSLPTLILLIFLVSKFLVNAKKDELERNNAKVQSVLTTAQELSEKMLEAGNVLSGISASETAVAQELSATSQNLLVNSNELRRKAGTSITNLNELKQSGAALSENVKKVGETSDEIMQKSTANEDVLNSLRSVNKDVIRSMEQTNAVAMKLTEAVTGIDATLNLISDVAMQTNILSINATIEAARAGEAGKGFAVVAQEVGTLANSTQQSLAEIQSVMDRVKKNVEEMTAYVGDNNKKLMRQNEYFSDVFSNMQEINVLLRQSMDEITAMSRVHERQSDIIRTTVDINADIAESIENENKEFNAISNIVGNNAKDAVHMQNQVDAINAMAGQIDELLK